MKQFKRMKPVDTITNDAKALGFEVDFTEWDKGSDWFWIRDMEGRLIQIAVNCFGRFMVYKPCSDAPVATERSEELDKEEWYQEILNIIYES